MTPKTPTHPLPLLNAPRVESYGIEKLFLSRYHLVEVFICVVTEPKINYRWGCALKELYRCDRKLWLLFAGQVRSVRSNVM